MLHGNMAAKEWIADGTGSSGSLSGNRTVDQRKWGDEVTLIECGPARLSLAVSAERIADVRTRGLFVSANASAISARALEAAVAEGAAGMLVSLEGVLLAIPPPTPQHYAYVAPELRAIPVALVITGEQIRHFQAVGIAAAQASTIRRAFLSRDEACAWLREQTRALAAARVWRPAYR
jgi:hypothetical protein